MIKEMVDHDRLIQKYGGESGILNRGILEFSVYLGEQSSKEVRFSSNLTKRQTIDEIIRWLKTTHCQEGAKNGKKKEAPEQEN